MRTEVQENQYWREKKKKGFLVLEKTKKKKNLDWAFLMSKTTRKMIKLCLCIEGVAEITSIIALPLTLQTKFAFASPCKSIESQYFFLILFLPVFFFFYLFSLNLNKKKKSRFWWYALLIKVSKVLRLFAFFPSGFPQL